MNIKLHHGESKYSQENVVGIKLMNVNVFMHITSFQYSEMIRGEENTLGVS